MQQQEKIVVEFKNVVKSFGNNHVLKKMNLQLKKGENLVVLGKSGSGKSVLIKCLVRLIEADAGDLIIFDKNVNEISLDDLNVLRKKIGFLFQSGALYDSMSVRENLEFHLREKKEMDQDEKDKLVQETLKGVGLDDVIDKMPSELSGGMRKRLGLARTLIQDPEIMLYDEPTTGLDPITSKEISKLILKVQKEHKTSSIIITHDIECARITHDRIAVIDGGKVVEEGKYDDLVKSKNEVVKAFFK
jgi:phospholipid/cholesterol/gamma-HCH transport system ATP-binding protein